MERLWHHMWYKHEVQVAHRTHATSVRREGLPPHDAVKNVHIRAVPYRLSRVILHAMGGLLNIMWRRITDAGTFCYTPGRPWRCRVSSFDRSAGLQYCILLSRLQIFGIRLSALCEGTIPNPAWCK